MARRTPPPAATAAFRGFPDPRGDFFLALALHNDRDWFQAHKAEYQDGWAGPLAALLAEVREGLVKAYRGRTLGEPRLFRLHRDTRFSKDKSPYKTHAAGWIPLVTGKEASPPASAAALYFHVGVDEVFSGSGSWLLEPEALARYRAAVLDPRRGADLTRRLKALAAKGFTASCGESLARVPKGVDPEHPRAALLRMKGLVVDPGEVPRRLLTRPDLAAWLVERARAAAPVVTWLADHVA